MTGKRDGEGYSMHTSTSSSPWLTFWPSLNLAFGAPSHSYNMFLLHFIALDQNLRCVFRTLPDPSARREELKDKFDQTLWSYFELELLERKGREGTYHFGHRVKR
jgi:hypothetical protein